MIALATKQNPVVGFWDPLGIVTEDTAPETIGWFRHAEIKHGRVAMAAFVGYLAGCGFTKGFAGPFPWNLQTTLDYGPGWPFTKDLATISFADIAAAGGPADQWDALPTAAEGQKHYVRGGKPGYYPSFQGRYPHPVPLDLWD